MESLDNKVLRDIIGNEILLGSMVAVSRKGRSAGTLEVGIVIAISSSKIYIIKPRKRYRREAKTSLQRGWVNYPNTRQFVNSMIVIAQPLYALENEAISVMLEIMDLGKVAGYLPKDYTLGVPFEPIKDISDEELIEIHEEDQEEI